MGRIALALVLAVAGGWFMFGRGGEAAAVTDCLANAGAVVEESEQFAQTFPYAIAVRSLDRVQSYPELDGATFYSVRYGSDRALLFVGDDTKDAEAFERTLGGMVGGMVGAEGGTMASRRSGEALLVWERATSAPAVDTCFD